MYLKVDSLITLIRTHTRNSHKHVVAMFKISTINKLGVNIIT